MKLWVTLLITSAIAASGAIAVARAERVPNPTWFDTTKRCASKHPCLAANNTEGPGMVGSSHQGPGIMGNSSTGAGVFANGDYGYGVYAYSANNDAIYADGNVQVTGEIYTGGSCKNGCTKTRQQMSFAARASQPMIDDVGEAALRDGVAHVALAADFANAIDTSKPYVVLLTPEGDASLYVAIRTARGFEVRQIGFGHSSISFAYRIVAKPYAASDERLPFRTVKDRSAPSVGR